jgi:hypothetical protein
MRPAAAQLLRQSTCSCPQPSPCWPDWLAPPQPGRSRETSPWTRPRPGRTRFADQVRIPVRSHPHQGRVAQRESAALTRQRSEVQLFPRPPAQTLLVRWLPHAGCQPVVCRLSADALQESGVARRTTNSQRPSSPYLTIPRAELDRRLEERIAQGRELRRLRRRRTRRPGSAAAAVAGRGRQIPGGPAAPDLMDRADDA